PECTLLAVSTVSARGADRTVAGTLDVARSTVITVGIGETLIQFGLTPVVAVIPGLGSALGVGAADAAWILTVFILALAGTLLVSGRLPAATRGPRGDVDWLGAALLDLTITVVAIALNHPHGTTTSDVMPVFHVVLPVIALAAAALFVLLERRRSEPLMHWRQVRHGGFAAAIGLNPVLHLTMMATMYLGPVLVVRGLGRS